MSNHDDIVPKDQTATITTSDISSYYRNVVNLTRAAEVEILPNIGRDRYESERESAIAGTYYRMFAWMKCLTNMDNRVHFQGVAAGARALFELFIDIRMLSDDKSSASAKKYHAFSDVDKLIKATKRIQFYTEELKEPNECEVEKNWLAGNENRINEIISKLWLNNKGKPFIPKHWSGISKIETRVKILDKEYQKKFVDNYKIFSWYIHPGPQGYAGYQADFFEILYGHSMLLAFDLFREATKICAAEFNISIHPWNPCNLRFRKPSSGSEATPTTEPTIQKKKCVRSPLR